MRRNNEIKDSATKVYQAALEGLLEVEKSNMDLLKTLGDESTDSGLDKVITLVKCIALQVYGTDVDGVRLPEFLWDVTGFGDTCKTVRISIRSKQKARVRIKDKITVDVNEDFVANVGKKMLDMAVQMYYIDAGLENIDALNAVLAEIYEAGEVDKKVFFAISDKTARVISITDDELILKAGLEESHKVADLGIMAGYGLADEDISEFDRLVNERSSEEFTAVMKTCQTTQEIIKKRITWVETMADLHTRKSAYKIIREGYHMKVENAAKNSVGYFNSKVGDIDVFSLIAKDADGNLSVVLSPFDTATNEPVDVDVLKEIA